MSEFFMGLSSLLGWGVAGVYVALGVVVTGIIVGAVAGVILYRRKKNLNQGILSKAKSKIKGKDGKSKSGEITKTRVKDNKKFDNFLESQPDKVEKKVRQESAKTEEMGESNTKINLKKKKDEKKVSEASTTEYPDFADIEEEIGEALEIENEATK
ncbi:MAG: hypothetical protein ACI4TX_04780 [Christensenellales bacterium]